MFAEWPEKKRSSGSTQLLDLTGVLIAADTVVSLGDEVLAKPESPQQAEGFLMRLANTTHEVRSAVCVIASDGNSPLAPRSVKRCR